MSKLLEKMFLSFYLTVKLIKAGKFTAFIEWGNENEIRIEIDPNFISRNQISANEYLVSLIEKNRIEIIDSFCANNLEEFEKDLPNLLIQKVIKPNLFINEIFICSKYFPNIPKLGSLTK